MSALFLAKEVALVRGGRLLFEGLNLAVHPGDAVHLAGPNGSGKSSLIRLAAGLLRPSAGMVERAAAALADDALALDRELSLGRALRFWKASRTGEALEAFGLSGLEQAPVRLLSTGQAKRAALARVMASGAALWLLDEPLNGLDLDGTKRLAAALAAHRSGGGAVIAASHVAMPGQWRTLELRQ